MINHKSEAPSMIIAPEETIFTTVSQQFRILKGAFAAFIEETSTHTGAVIIR